MVCMDTPSLISTFCPPSTHMYTSHPSGKWWGTRPSEVQWEVLGSFGPELSSHGYTDCGGAGHKLWVDTLNLPKHLAPLVGSKAEKGLSSILSSRGSGKRVQLPRSKGSTAPWPVQCQIGKLFLSDLSYYCQHFHFHLGHQEHGVEHWWESRKRVEIPGHQ